MTVILLGTSWKRWLASCWPNDKDEADHPREVRSVPKNVRFTPHSEETFSSVVAPAATPR